MYQYLHMKLSVAVTSNCQEADDVAAKNGGKPERTLVLITPRIQIQEEEETAVEKPGD